jgi:uncharacterized surface protein with fasciclin (FAS1) repeats
MSLDRITPIAAALAITCFCFGPTSQATDSAGKPILIAANTKEFKEKEGFERKPKDIMNTLKDNDTTTFHTLVEGLDQAFALDNKLKNKGPFTLFAPSDKAFKKMPDADVASLFANKTKLKQVLQDEIVSGKLDSKALRLMTSVKTLGGGEIRLSTKNGDLYADHALVTMTDIPCSNGIIHIVDEVVMPQLSK